MKIVGLLHVGMLGIQGDFGSRGALSLIVCSTGCWFKWDFL